jgi:CyaY protein
MEREEFLRLADATMERVARWLETFDPDEIDFATSDGVLTLEFADKKRFVLNRQTAADQMWLAAGARAWHFDWNAAERAWVDDRDGHELLARLAEIVSQKIGRDVSIR